MQIQENFGYVCITVVAAWIVHHVYMATKVMKARKKYEVAYPNLYADKDNCPNEANRKAFNCVQRGHQNSLENLPIFLASLIITGLVHPLVASAFGVMYLLGRIAYVEGYSTGIPDKRINIGTAVGFIGLLGLMGTAVRIAVALLAGV